MTHKDLLLRAYGRRLGRIIDADLDRRMEERFEQFENFDPDALGTVGEVIGPKHLKAGLSGKREGFVPIDGAWQDNPNEGEEDPE